MWPCGEFTLNFKELDVNWPTSHWAFYTSTSYRIESPLPGRVIYRVCKGNISCSNTSCNITVRPQVKNKGKGIEKQISKSCPHPDCKAKLQWHKCDAKAYWTVFDSPNDEGVLATLKHIGNFLKFYSFILSSF